MAVLHTQPLDELGGGPAGLRELLSHSLAQRSCERIHLPNRGLAGLLHRDYQSSGRRRACAKAAPTVALVLLQYDRHFEAIVRATGQPAQWLAERGSLD